ncbi:hypothetical protein ACOSQ2_032811 [Xanthoceras sorbifolium]
MSKLTICTLENLWGKAGTYLDELQGASQRGYLVPNLVSAKKTWLPPPFGCYKLNVDAAFNHQKRAAGLGVVVRDDCGVPRVAASWFLKGIMDIEVGEAMALLEGLKVAIDRNLFPLLIESDSSNVVNLCNNLISSRTEVGVIIQEIKLRIAPFPACSFSHVSC